MKVSVLERCPSYGMSVLRGFTVFENQQILSPVIIPKITGKIVLDIRECKNGFLTGLYSLYAKISFHEERKKA